jgi:hypothetical protein
LATTGFKKGEANNWFQKRRSYKLTCYSSDGSFGTITDYFILTGNLCNILNDVKVIPITGLEGDHKTLIAEFRKVAERRPTVYQEKKIEIWKLKERDKKEQFQQLLRTKLPNYETQSVEEKWDRFKTGFTKAAEEVCGQKRGMRKYKETSWWTVRIKKGGKE